MVLPSCKPVHAWHRHGAGVGHDPCPQASQRQHRSRWAIRAGLILLLLGLPGLALARDLRLATYDAGLTRTGPGLVLQLLTKASDPQIEAALTVIVALDADVLVLTSLDYDYDGAALSALQARLKEKGLDYPEALALRPNSGVATGLDLDHDGALNGPRDAQGYGLFAGQAGMAVLSRLPLDRDHILDLSGFLWKDLPGADLPLDLAPEAAAVQRLSTSGHYVVPVIYAEGKVLNLLLWSATPPVFDGPEDRNGRRNADETALWRHLLAGDLPQVQPPAAPFALIGLPNADPADGDGKREAIRALLSSPLVQDPAPKGSSGRSDGQKGDPALDTTLVGKAGAGLRLDMILPSRDIAVTGAGVMWPPEADPMAATLATASRHRPVWVTLTLP